MAKKAVKVVKNAGDVFEYDGTSYRCLHNIGLKLWQAQPIYHEGNTRPVKIESALKKGFIEVFYPGVNKITSEQTYDGVDGLGLRINACKSCPDQVHEVATPEGIYQEKNKKIDIKKEKDKKITYGTGLFYLPANYRRVQSYLAQALIKPSTCNDLYSDPQSVNPYMLLLHNVQTIVSEDQLEVEIFLTQHEYDNCIKCEGCLLCSLPLPISRIKKILVPKGDEPLDIYLKGWILDDVPVPKQLFAFAEGNVMEVSWVNSPVVVLENKRKNNINNIEESIDYYNRLLGALAYMRNVSKYYSKKRGRYQSVPQLYCNLVHWLQCPSALIVDPIIELILKNGKSNRKGDEVEFFNLIMSPGNADIDKMKLLAGRICKQYKQKDTEVVFEKLLQGNYIGVLELLRQHEYPLQVWILVALYQYRMKNSNDYRSLKQKIAENWIDPKMASKVMTILGAYYGYKRLDANEYKIYSIHPEIEPLVPARPAIKYHLDTLHDRMVIESVYQLTFYESAGRCIDFQKMYEQWSKSFNTASLIASKQVHYSCLTSKCPWLAIVCLEVNPVNMYFQQKILDVEPIITLINKLDEAALYEYVLVVLKMHIKEPFLCYMLQQLRDIKDCGDLTACCSDFIKNINPVDLTEMLKRLYDGDKTFKADCNKFMVIARED